MNYTRALAVLIIAGTMATGTYSWGMEAEPVASVRPSNLLSDEDTQVMLDELWKLDQKPKNEIILLALEGSLSYNFTCSHTLQETTERVDSVVFSRDGASILTGARDGRARLWDVETGKLLHLLDEHTNSITAVAFSPDGATALTGSLDGTARLWDVKTGKQLHVLHPTSGVREVAYSPEGTTVLTVANNFSELQLWESTTGKQLKVVKGYNLFCSVSFIFCSVSFSPCGKFLCVGSKDGTVRLLDIKTGQPLPTLLEGHINWVSSVAFSPDEAIVLTRSDDCTVRLWNSQTGKQLHVLRYAMHLSVAFSPDGTTVLTGSKDHIARLWDVKTGKKLKKLKGHTKPINSVAFSPDGITALTGSRDGTVRLWDVKTGQQLHILEGHTWPISSVAFSPDGTTVLTLGSDGKACLWARLERSNEWCTTREEVAFDLFMKYYPLLIGSRNGKKSTVLSFAQAINLDDDSQKECSIQ